MAQTAALVTVLVTVLATSPAAGQSGAHATAGEVRAAPLVIAGEGAPDGAGRLVGADAPRADEVVDVDRQLMLAQRVFVVAPRGAPVRPGAMFLSVRRGPVLPGLGQILVPTGVIEVERAAGPVVEARVRELFGTMRVGQAVLPLDGPLPRGVGAGPAARRCAGRDAVHVAWVAGEPVLPTLFDYAIIDCGADAGVRAGDLVTFVRPAFTTGDAARIPESEIGVARVVRVFGRAATVVLVQQMQPGLAPGTVGRVSPAMP